MLALLFLTKIYGAARFSLTTSTALAAAASPVSVLFGTLGLYEYAFIGLAASASAWAFVAGIRQAGVRWWWPLTLPLAVFLSLLTPFYYLKWAIASILVVFALRDIMTVASRIFSRADQPWVVPSYNKIAVMVAMAAVMTFVFATIQRPWLPAEVVNLSKPITIDPMTHEEAARPVAYIIAEGNGWVTLLIDSDRYLAIVPETEVERQRICHLNGQLGNGQPFFDWIIGRPYVSPNLSCSDLTDQPEEKGR